MLKVQTQDTQIQVLQQQLRIEKEKLALQSKLITEKEESRKTEKLQSKVADSSKMEPITISSWTDTYFQLHVFFATFIYGLIVGLLIYRSYQPSYWM